MRRRIACVFIIWGINIRERLNILGLRKDIKLKVFLWCEMEKDLVDFVYMSRKNKRSDELLITEYGMLAAGLLVVAVI
jgi:hypothetical protein